MNTALIALLLTAVAPQVSEGVSPQSAEPVRPEMLHGLWSNNGSCSRGMLIRADGTFHSYLTEADGTWDLEGDMLTLTADDQIQALRLLSVETDLVIMATADGSVGSSFRCPDRPQIPVA